MRERLDVVIPTLNSGAMLAEAVESALAQDGFEVTVHVVADGGREPLVLPAATSGRVAVHRHQTNRGIGAARNTGVAAGTSPWLAFLDADDLWPPGRSLLLREVIAHPGRDISLGRMQVFSGPAPDPASAGPGPTALLAGGMLLSRRVFHRVGPFREDVRVGEFVDWLARARSCGVREVQAPAVSLFRRSHENNTTRGDVRDYLRVIADHRRRGSTGN